jgi:hypothetical protein
VGNGVFYSTRAKRASRNANVREARVFGLY